MFSLLLAGAMLCLALIAFRRFLLIPWFVCTIIEHIAWPLGWQTYVRATGGPGWYMGRIGAERIYFIRRDPDARRVPALRKHDIMFCLLALLIGPIAALSLSACSTISAVTDAKVPAKTIIVAANAFDGLKVTAKNYLVYCTPNPAPIGCDDAAIKNKLVPAIKSGTTARDTLEQFLADHPGQLGDKGVYDALVDANSTIQSVIANFKG